MDKCIIVEGKLFMDKVYGPEAKEAFKKDYDDWGHKDKVKEVFAIIEKADYEYYKTQGIMDTECKYISTNKQEAYEELEAINE